MPAIGGDPTLFLYGRDQDDDLIIVVYDFAIDKPKKKKKK